jgi:two-component system LytT family response regulator
MKLKIIIIDDEADAIDVLESIIEINSQEYEIVAKTTNPIEGIELILKHKPDVVFLDIEMPELNGFQVLESISNIDFEVIFATAYDNYAIKAIKENALDYILKPATIPEVMDALAKAKNKKSLGSNLNTNLKDLLVNLKESNKQRIKIPTASGFELINTEELVYFEADGSYTTAYLKNGERIIVSKPIKQLESMLNSSSFFRVHRSYIVNVSYVKCYERENYSLKMVDNSIVPVSRRRLDSFLEFLDNIR